MSFCPVADETIFQDIEKLSDGRVKVPEGIQLSKVDSSANFSRPGAQQQKNGKNQQRHKNGKNKKQHNNK